MSYYVAASAIGTLMDYGYTEAEAKRIRGFMPRRFQMFGQVLPLTNIEAWLAYLAVKHYCQNTEERGRFGLDYPSGYLNMQPHEKMHYVTKDQKVEFSTREFVRHFGDALFTDMNHEAGHRIIRLNDDGSFVIKNRCLEAMIREMESRAKRHGISSNPSFRTTNGMAGELHLPKDEQYTGRDILKMFYHGKLAKEYTRQPDGWLLSPSGLDYHQVAKYMLFLHNELRAGKPHGGMFHGERISIQSAMNSRQSYYYNPVLVDRVTVVLFSDGTLLTPDGVYPNTLPTPQSSMSNHNFASDLARVCHQHQTYVTPVIPVTMRDYFTDQEWLA